MNHNYSAKPVGYFNTARKSFVDMLPHNEKARLLEIGTGSGDTAALALAEGKCGWCCGVELCEGPAVEARKKIQQVIVGDIERIKLDLPEKFFDILLLSEVLEHLVDPWSVLKKLKRFMKPGAIVIAGSPNVCDWHVIWTQLCGKWYYQDKGIWDATHVRWFSPESYREMFVDSGFVVDEVGPSYPLRIKARIFNVMTLRRFEYLLHSQVVLKGHCPA
ncbi:MAG: class I SAM-dependent methyltransferase [Verrucomicrobiota bacterium]|jgi:ubiquinone/menaquinone biosynthesis C-methylase UbiE